MSPAVKKICDEKIHLSEKQRSFCKSNYSMFQQLENGAKLALKHCKRVMKFEQWNCSSHKFKGDKSAYYVLDDEGKSQQTIW